MEVDSKTLANLLAKLMADPRLIEPTLRYVERTEDLLREAENEIFYSGTVTPAEASTDVDYGSDGQ